MSANNIFMRNFQGSGHFQNKDDEIKKILKFS